MKEKELYLSPESEEITVRLEGVIALSTESLDPTFVAPFNPEELW